MGVQAARLVREILDELLKTPVAKLGGPRVRGRLELLQSSVPELKMFADSLVMLGDTIEGKLPRQGALPVRAGNAKRRASSPRPRDGFRPTPFVLEAVRQSGDAGVSPREIVERVKSIVPGRHARPANLVSPLLNRLKKRGQVVNREGRWFAA